MPKDPKLITSSVNLPVNVINTLVNVDDRIMIVLVSPFPSLKKESSSIKVCKNKNLI